MATTPISKPSWRDLLQQTLQSLRKGEEPPRVAVIGSGNELNGDDAAGLAVVRALKPALAALDRLLVIDAGLAPENQTGPLRTFQPDLVLLVDAAQMGEAPGTVRWLRWQETTGLSASTHTLPLYVLAHYLTLEFGCDVALLGIQPQQNVREEALSPVVEQAVGDVVQGLSAAFLPS